MDKGQVAEVLVSIATLLELKGENPFKTRAYENAARTIETLSEPLDKVVAEERAWATSKASAMRSSRRSPNSSPPAACSITRT
jgi:DNA polymerase/3'-5' exonuclease PolX